MSIQFNPAIHPSYKQQFDKLTEAYIKGEIKPCEPRFCFCGTICNNDKSWYGWCLEGHNDSHGYTGNDFLRMEKALFSELTDEYGQALHSEGTQGYENDLFNGMCAALEVLKQIHIERGEIIDEVPAFTKRQLQQT